MTPVSDHSEDRGLSQASQGSGLSGMPGSVLQIPVSVQVLIGTARMPLAKLAQLGPGGIIVLDQKLGSAATILVNGKEVAKGELFVFESQDDSGKLGITITEVTPATDPARP